MFISFCPGFATDDVTAHEWGHAYTEYMHGLIYEWQSGALNESYSDIWGETVDRINGRDLFSFHNAPRTADSCSAVLRRAAPGRDGHGRQRGRHLSGADLGCSSRRCP